MARSELIGLIECPECGYKDAEVRNDKSGAPFRYCPDQECLAQYFTRGRPRAVRNLLAKVRRIAEQPASVAPVAPVKADATDATPAASKPVKAVKKAFSMDDI